MASGNGNQKLHITATDLGGHAQVRRVWKDYFHGIDAVVFVLDAADRQDKKSSITNVIWPEKKKLTHVFIYRAKRPVDEFALCKVVTR